MRLAMFGGSFDPVHNDHVSLCKQMISLFRLDKVIVFPAACSPFKKEAQTADYHRLNMCKLAFNAVKKAEVSDYEISKGGKSYTVDTLEFLKRTYPDCEIYLITGADAFLSLPDWHRAEDIFSLAHILTVVRNGDGAEVLKKAADEFSKCYDARISLVTAPVGSLSSTEIRNMLAKKDESVMEYLPSAVWKYIKENGLY